MKDKIVFVIELDDKNRNFGEIKETMMDLLSDVDGVINFETFWEDSHTN